MGKACLPGGQDDLKTIGLCMYHVRMVEYGTMVTCIADSMQIAVLVLLSRAEQLTGTVNVNRSLFPTNAISDGKRGLKRE